VGLRAFVHPPLHTTVRWRRSFRCDPAVPPSACAVGPSRRPRQSLPCHRRIRGLLDTASGLKPTSGTARASVVRATSRGRAVRARSRIIAMRGLLVSLTGSPHRRSPRNRPLLICRWCPSLFRRRLAIAEAPPSDRSSRIISGPRPGGLHLQKPAGTAPDPMGSGRKRSASSQRGCADRSSDGSCSLGPLSSARDPLPAFAARLSCRGPMSRFTVLRLPPGQIPGAAPRAPPPQLMEFFAAV
jgi:hypothetical protein